MNQAEVCGNALVKRMQLFNRRMTDPLTAKAWYFYVRTYELTNVRPSPVHSAKMKMKNGTQCGFLID
jgi:hypothetical protein